ncbi:hypothetical protein BC936DRAFT_144910 [Jimgerdemannia flammicorona]|uniref:Uncharacterized protein n=1 Tax=Jimgerdemannia flammicorona TaxID=994334 RepID=A0A433DBD7_9FUNG|nr:hypothetical protein BC936DRAFT_144910 [Jimgerdemannia flammicorona]
MPDTYHFKFVNNTPEPWAFCIWQKYPVDPAYQVKTLVWNKRDVPSTGEGNLYFDIKYSAIVGDVNDPDIHGVWQVSQSKDTVVGDEWTVDLDALNDQVLDKAPSSAPPGHIIINNNSGQFANIGIGMDGSPAVIVPNVQGGANEDFNIHPTYYVGLTQNVVNGVSIDSVTFTSPQKVTFSNGNNACQVTATQSSQGNLTVAITYSHENITTRNQLRRLKGIDFEPFTFAVALSIIGLTAAAIWRIIKSRNFEMNLSLAGVTVKASGKSNNDNGAEFDVITEDELHVTQVKDIILATLYETTTIPDEKVKISVERQRIKGQVKP